MYYFTELSQLTLNYHKLPKFVFGITKLGRLGGLGCLGGVGVKSFHQAKIRAITLVLCGPERVALEGLALLPHPRCIILLNLRCGLEKQSKPSAQAGMGKKAQKVLNLCAAFIDFPPQPRLAPHP